MAQAAHARPSPKRTRLRRRKLDGTSAERGSTSSCSPDAAPISHQLVGLRRTKGSRSGRCLWREREEGEGEMEVRGRRGRAALEEEEAQEEGGRRRRTPVAPVAVVASG